MSNEIRVAAEGALWWVQQSGSGRTWATATGPKSGLVGLVTDFSFSSGQTVTTIMERGRPNHHKITEFGRIEPTFNMGWTGTYAIPSAETGSGASVPMFALEFKAIRPEDFAGSGYYYQFLGGAMQSFDFKEAKEGDNVTLKFACLGMVGPTASGYLV